MLKRRNLPKHLLDHPDPEGPENVEHWTDVLHNHRIGMAVAAWGAHAGMGHLPASHAADRWRCGVSWMCLGTTKDGHPRHPLYVKGDTELVRFRGARLDTDTPDQPEEGDCPTCEDEGLFHRTTPDNFCPTPDQGTGGEG